MHRRLLYVSIVVIFSLMTNSMAVAHAGNRAYFTLRPDQHSVRLELRVHEHDISSILTAAKVCGADQDPAICAADYVRKGFLVSVNGKPLDLHFVSSVRTKGDEMFLFQINVEPLSIVTITIENTCFVTVQRRFENIVRFLLRDDVSYSMNDRRTTITHTF